MACRKASRLDGGSIDGALQRWGNGFQVSGVCHARRALGRADFPAFVAGLIDGVFNAIVTASIQQLKAYGELLKNAAKPVD